MERYIGGRLTGAGIGLLIGIIVLTAVLIGGLLFVKHQGEQARRTEAIKIAEEKLKAESGGDVALGGGAVNSDQGSDSDKGGSQGSESTASGQASQQAAHGSSPSQLPQTGPADGLLIIVLGLTTYTAVAYYRSRQALL